MIPVSTTTSAGDLVTQPGQVQFGALLLGNGTNAGWFDLVGWRDAPSVSISDTTRPQAHGSYPGDVWGESKSVTFIARLDNTGAERLSDLRAIEANLPLDGVERPLVVDDGSGPTLRMGRVVARQVPQDWDFLNSRVLEVSVQWVCADPRRYSLASISTSVALGSSTGGLSYALVYPLSYGTTVGGSRSVNNNGSTASPAKITFSGPLINPALVSSSGWRLAFRITLAAGETLVVDTAEGSALLNGDTDRLYTIDATSSPLERCLLPVGATTLSLSAASGTGQAAVTYRHAYL